VTGNSGDDVIADCDTFTALTRKIVSDNSSPEVSVYAPECYSPDVVSAGNFNLFGHRGWNNVQAFENFTPGPTDITATANDSRPTALSAIINPRLSNNGGRTQTHALVTGGPAIDAVTDGTCPPPATDQRSVTRPRDGNCDGVPHAISVPLSLQPRPLWHHGHHLHRRTTVITVTGSPLSLRLRARQIPHRTR
jgi:hypothetical protein